MRELGVDHVIDYQKQDFAEIIKAETEGAGVDVILDHIGAPYLKRNLSSLGTGGSLVLIGVMGGVKEEINLAQLMVRRQKSSAPYFAQGRWMKRGESLAVSLQKRRRTFSDGTLSPLIDHVFPLEQVRQAHELMDRSGHFGKIVLQMDPDVAIH